MSRSKLDACVRVKALTIRQPWASLVAQGIKQVENRTWQTPYRGPLLVHAGKSPWRGMCRRAWELLEGTEHGDIRGYLLGVVQLVDVVPPGDVEDEWASNRGWCWILEEPTLFSEPVPCPGSQMLWTPSRRALRAVRQQLG